MLELVNTGTLTDAILTMVNVIGYYALNTKYSYNSHGNVGRPWGSGAMIALASFPLRYAHAVTSCSPVLYPVTTKLETLSR